jgi:hypothetical protein
MYPNGSTSLTPTLNAIFSKLDTSSRWRVGSWSNPPTHYLLIFWMDTAVFLLYNFRFSGHHFELLSMDISGQQDWSPNFRPVIVRMCLTYWRLRLRLELVMYFRLGTFIHRLSSTQYPFKRLKGSGWVGYFDNLSIQLTISNVHSKVHYG